MLYDIKINKDKVFDEVGRITATIGASNMDAEGNSLYDIVATTKYDLDLLRQFMEQAFSTLAPAYRQYLACTQETDSDLIIRVDMPDNFNAAFMDGMVRSSFDYMVNSILVLWCGIKAKNEVELYTQKATSNMIDINNKLYSRKPPIRLEP